MVQIKQVKSGMGKFFRFPAKLYKCNEFYKHIDAKDEKSFFSKKKALQDGYEYRCWLAFDKKCKVVGRIAVVIPSDKEKKQAHITRFDFVDKYEVSQGLLDVATEYAQEKGMQAIRGPIGFSDDDKRGCLVDGFDRKCSLDTTVYNYGYYAAHFEKMGFEKEMDWLEFEAGNSTCVEALESNTEAVKQHIDKSLIKRRRCFTKKI